MLKHVLVPLDGSKLAEEALDYAREVVAPDGKISLVCAIEVNDPPAYGYYAPVTMPDNEATKNELLPIAQHYLEGLASDLNKDGIKARFEVSIGDPVTVISETAERLHVDAIVMSTHGRSGISRFIFGSVTNKILGTKICPVFVIPSKSSVAHERPVKASAHIN
jgi:nucleotide-binding universal stress UspA family protein